MNAVAQCGNVVEKIPIRTGKGNEREWRDEFVFKTIVISGEAREEISIVKCGALDKSVETKASPLIPSTIPEPLRCFRYGEKSLFLR